MKLPKSEAIASTLTILPEVGSTNEELVARAKFGSQPHFGVLVSDNQTNGKGRNGRVWVAPAGKALAASVLLRTGQLPLIPAEALGWLPLIAGVAMATAVRSLVAGNVTLKWPNDVQIDGLKVSGLLAELLPNGDVVIGAGVNLTTEAEELPTASSTSLVLAGATNNVALADSVLSVYLTELRSLYESFIAAGGHAQSDGIAELVVGQCATIGQTVRVQLPDGSDIVGMATGLDALGRLRVHRESDGENVAVAAGDVTHLRYE